MEAFIAIWEYRIVGRFSNRALDERRPESDTAARMSEFSVFEREWLAYPLDQHLPVGCLSLVPALLAQSVL